MHVVAPAAGEVAQRLAMLWDLLAYPRYSRSLPTCSLEHHRGTLAYLAAHSLHCGARRATGPWPGSR